MRETSHWTRTPHTEHISNGDHNCSKQQHAYRHVHKDNGQDGGMRKQNGEHAATRKLGRVRYLRPLVLCDSLLPMANRVDVCAADSKLRLSVVSHCGIELMGTRQSSICVPSDTSITPERMRIRRWRRLDEDYFTFPRRQLGSDANARRRSLTQTTID